MTEIDLRDVKTAVNAALDHLIRTRGVTKVTIDKNFYWEVQAPELYDMANSNPDLIVGSIVDEWSFCRNLLTGTSPPVANQLQQLAPILRYLGFKLGEQLASEGA